MVRDLELDELVEHFTLYPDELELLRNKAGANRLGFAVSMKFLLWKARFPSGRSELPDSVIEFVAKQVGVAACEIGLYELGARQAKRHRAEIRRATGFRPCSLADAETLTGWLTQGVARADRRPDRIRAVLLEHCRDQRIEPPTPERINRIIGSATHRAEAEACATIAVGIPADTVTRMLDLIAAGPADEAAVGGDPTTPVGGLGLIKADPGSVSLKTLGEEVAKLAAVRAVGIPAGLFDTVAPRIVAGWRARAAAEAPSHLREHPQATTVTLLAALLYCRAREITDTLVDLLIATVHRINARAERKVVEQFVTELRRVSGKETILFRIAEAALAHPEGAVRDVVFPAAGGEATLADLRAEYRSKGGTWRQHQRRVFKASYTNHYRRGIIALVTALQFRSNNTAHRPVLDALELICRYARKTTNSTIYFPANEKVPIEGVVPADWVELLHHTDSKGRTKVARAVYECAVFQTLRDKLRCKEIWVIGADRWRNPDADLPADFDTNRVAHYQALRKPLDPAEFIQTLRTEMDTGLTALNDALPELPWLTITAGRKAGPITLTQLDAAPEPTNLRRLKHDVKSRWGTLPLLDMVTETALRTGALNGFTPTGSRDTAIPDLLERLLLVIYAYGTNTGIRAVAAGDHPHSEDSLRYIRRRYLTVEACRTAARTIANATFAARHPRLWGQGTTAVASDSTHFTAYDQNIFTEWHSRYRRGKRGVLIYWHVEKAGSMAVHSQLISCSASEVHAMVEGAMRHGTNMNIESNYVDTHGQSVIGFGITRLLDFDLLPRIKAMNHLNLYRPTTGNPDAYPRLTPALTRPIRWDLIAEQYDSMMKYATAIRLGTATTEAILRRFTKDVTHPAYTAMLEVGRAQRTIWATRYLGDRDLQRETNAGLNVVENYNGVNDYIHFGKSGELSSNRREEQELSMLCLQILLSSLAYINTLMIQDIIAEPEWENVLTDADQRGLTPLFHTNMTPYGDISLHMGQRIALSTPAQPDNPNPQP